MTGRITYIDDLLLDLLRQKETVYFPN